MVRKDGAILSFSRFVQLNLIVLYSSSLDLFGDAFLHVPRRLPYLEEPLMRFIPNGVGINTRSSFRLRREDRLDGLTHHLRYLLLHR